MKTLSTLALAFMAFALSLTSVQAAPMTCPDPIPSGSGYITVDTNPSSTCLTTGSNNVDLSGFGLILLDKAGGGHVAEGALTILEVPEPGIPEGKGTFSIDALLVAGFTDLVLTIKGGNLNSSESTTDLQWSAFTLGALNGTWTIQDFSGKYKGLSGGELWGKRGTSAVPLPASVWLFGTALLGFASFARRTKV